MLVIGRRVLVLSSVLLAAAGCGGETAPGLDADGDADADADGDADTDTDADGDGDVWDEDIAAFYAPDRMVEISIEMSDADVESLRHQTRDVNEMLRGQDCLAQPFPSPFTYFPATVTVDGETLDDVGVRKKGLLGSLSETKPSLKIDFGEYLPEQRYHGIKKLTLNNSKSDPAFVRQCLGYELFAQAGVAAPRCNFAHVEVNGLDLGVFVNIESLGTRFLRGHFGDGTGNLYEGTLSDFRPGWVGSFENKADRLDDGDLEAATRALESPDDSLVAALDEVFDVDQFLTYWAMEILTAHVDGYASNTNNFYAYHDPTSDRFVFMPWGIDATFYGGNPFGGSYDSVYATGMLARRLYLLAETRDRYVARLLELLDTLWDEDAIVERIDRMEAVLSPVADPDGTVGLAQAVQGVRDFVRSERSLVLAEIGTGRAPEWTDPLREPPCLVNIGTASGTFQTTFGTVGAADPFAVGAGTLDAEVDGEPLGILATTAEAGYDPNSPGTPVVIVVAALDDGTIALAVLPVADPARFVPGATIPLELNGAWAALLSLDPATNTMTSVGLLLNGTIQMDQATLQDGGAVSGSFSGDVVRFPWL